MSSIDRVRNEDTHETLGQVVVVDMMKDRHLRSKEKLEGMAGGKLLKQVYEDEQLGEDQEDDHRRDGMRILNTQTGLCCTIHFIEHINYTDHAIHSLLICCNAY